MNRRHLAVVALLVGGVAASVAWWRERDTPSNVPMPSAATPETKDRIYASQALPGRRAEATALPAPNAAPATVTAERTAPTAQVIAEAPAKPVPKGFARGQLPTSNSLSSAPSVTASPRLKEAYAARTSRAAILDRRLERHIAALETKLEAASLSERSAIEHDLGILRAQLEARRPWESPDRATR